MSNDSHVPNLSDSTGQLWQLVDFDNPDRDDLQPGMVAQLTFEYPNPDAVSGPGAENMWVFVDSRHGDVLQGVLVNEPVADVPGLTHGAPIAFHPGHVRASGVDIPAMTRAEYLSGVAVEPTEEERVRYCYNALLGFVMSSDNDERRYNLFSVMTELEELIDELPDSDSHCDDCGGPL